MKTLGTKEWAVKNINMSSVRKLTDFFQFV